MFLALNSAAVYLYSGRALPMDCHVSKFNHLSFIIPIAVKFNNDCDDIMEYVKEGLMTSFAGFLVSYRINFKMLEAHFHGRLLKLIAAIALIFVLPQVTWIMIYSAIYH